MYNLFSLFPRFYNSRMPQLFTKDIALVQQFFESMCKVCLIYILYSSYAVIITMRPVVKM